MISTFLVEHSRLVPVAFWIAVVLTAVVGFLAYRRRARRLLSVLAALSLLAALLLVFTPDAAEAAPRFCAVQFSVPFAGLDTLANVALLLPLSVFTALRSGRPLLVAASSSGLSVLIEVVQGLAPGLGRACDTNDWLMNTVGAVLGVGIAVAIRTFVGQRRVGGERRH